MRWPLKTYSGSGEGRGCLCRAMCNAQGTAQSSILHISQEKKQERARKLHRKKLAEPHLSLLVRLSAALRARIAHRSPLIHLSRQGCLQQFITLEQRNGHCFQRMDTYSFTKLSTHLSRKRCLPNQVHAWAPPTMLALNVSNLSGDLILLCL